MPCIEMSPLQSRAIMSDLVFTPSFGLNCCPLSSAGVLPCPLHSPLQSTGVTRPLVTQQFYLPPSHGFTQNQDEQSCQVLINDIWKY